jgi:glycosyltransferase involved in cell wall biosynthesis
LKVSTVDPNRMQKPFISVLIDTYNHERFIEEAVRSVLSQDYPHELREILVVDDGSIDRTPEILAQFGEAIRVLRKSNGGQASAFNYGIPQCRGEIVAFLDGDDWWAPGKLRLLADAFSSNPSVGLVGNSITEALSGGVRRSELVRDTPRFRIDSVAGARSFRQRKSFLGTSRMSYRAELLRRIGTVPESLVFEADEFVFTLGAVFSEVLILREPLTYYRLHDQNLFQIADGNKDSLRRKYQVLRSLRLALQERLQAERVPPDVATIILDAIEAEADVLRLAADGGTPLEAVRVELRNYRLMHEDAPVFRRALKYVSMVPALFIPPAKYAAIRQKLAANAVYRKFRARFLPVLGPSHVDRTGHWSAP